MTGFARLDVYRRGGDSLMGRYHYLRLHPFILDGDERKAHRLRKERFDRGLREDIRDLEPIRNIQLLGLFVNALRHRVGGMITLSNLTGEIEVSPKTAKAKAWIELLERMYLVFVVRP